MALPAQALIRGWDVTPCGLSLRGWQGWGEGKRLGPGEVVAGLGQGGWLQALLHCSISHLLQHPDQVLEAEFSSPLAPLGFFAALCRTSACFPSRAAALLLTLSLQALGLPDAGLPCSVPKPSPPAAAQTWNPIPWSCLSSTPPSTLFCLKHFMSWDSS